MFREANLRYAKFITTTLTGSSFDTASLDYVEFRDILSEGARFGPSWSPEGGNECSLSVHKGRAYGSLGCIPINGLSRSSLAAMVSENIFAIFAHELERLGAIPASTIRRLTETVVEIPKLNWVEDELILGDPQPGGLPGLEAWIDDLLFNET